MTFHVFFMVIRAITLSAFSVMCAGIYTITAQVKEIQTYGIRDPDDVAALATANSGSSSVVQQGDNEPFFQEKKDDSE